MILSVEIVLPGLLLGLAFILKLAVDREVDIPSSIYAAMELPVDIFFLATSFIVAFTIANPDKSGEGFSYFALYILLIVIAIFCWRKSCKLFENNKHKSTVALTIVNYGICLFSLIKSIQLVQL